MSPTRRTTNAISRDGVNYVRTTLEHANCIFREINQENDYGNDAFVELVDDEEVTGEHLVVQIKSGKSYHDDSTCWIPATRRQLEYWRRHRLPVIGITYVPSEACAYWVSISSRLKGDLRNDSPSRIVFPRSELFRFDYQGLREFFLPFFLGKPIRFSQEKSDRLADSLLFDEHGVGLRSLFYVFYNDMSTWQKLERVLLSRSPEETSPELAYFLAHAPGHGDIAWHGPPLRPEIREEVLDRMRSYGEKHLLTLLALIDENGFARGSVGQSVFAIVDLAMSTPADKLQGIIDRLDRSERIRSNALTLLCLVAQEDAAPTLRKIVELDDDLRDSAGELLRHLQEEGFFYIS